MDATNECMERTIEVVGRFIEEVAADRQNTERYLTDRNAFTRKSPLSFLSMCKIGLLSVKSQYAAQVPIALGEIVNGVGGDPVPVSKSAYCQRRQKIRPALFRDWMRDIAGSGCIQPRKWHGLIPVAFDGTTVPVPRLYDNALKFGLWKNDAGETVPILKITLLCMLLDNMIMDVDVGGCERNERTAAMSMMDRLTPAHLLILDRGYPSYALMKVLTDMGVRFIIRLPASFSRGVREFVQSREESAEVTFRANSHVCKSLSRNNMTLADRNPIKLRCIDFVTPAGTHEILATNLDRGRFSDRDVADGYMLRWRIEVDIFFLKNEERWEELGGYKSACVLQDIYSACVLFNIQTLFENLSQSRLRKENDRRRARQKRPLAIYHSVALSILTWFLPGVLSPDSKRLHYATQLISMMVRTATVRVPSKSRHRLIRLKRITGKHWTDTNYKDSIIF